MRRPPLIPAHGAPRRRLAATLAAGAALSSAAPAPVASAQSADESPSGMVAFFMSAGTTCPAGWSTFTRGQGRLLVGAPASYLGQTVGAAMADRTPPEHSHSMSTTVAITANPAEPYASSTCAISWLCSHQGAQGGIRQYVPTGQQGTTTDGRTSDLPYIQLLVCQKD